MKRWTKVEVDENGITTYEIFNWQSIVDEGAPISDPKFNDAILTTAFHTYLDKLADGELPPGTKFIYRSDDKKGVDTVAELPDGTTQNVEADNPLVELRKRGVELQYSKDSVSIIVLNQRRCPECGDKFTSKRKDQIYCTEKCRNRVASREYRARKRKRTPA